MQVNSNNVNKIEGILNNIIKNIIQNLSPTDTSVLLNNIDILKAIITAKIAYAVNLDWGVPKKISKTLVIIVYSIVMRE
jgi:hypothetical protein